MRFWELEGLSNQPHKTTPLCCRGSEISGKTTEYRAVYLHLI